MTISMGKCSIPPPSPEFVSNFATDSPTIYGDLDWENDLINHIIHISISAYLSNLI
jgi:hypothetical protein